MPLVTKASWESAHLKVAVGVKLMTTLLKLTVQDQLIHSDTHARTHTRKNTPSITKQT